MVGQDHRARQPRHARAQGKGAHGHGKLRRMHQGLRQADRLRPEVGQILARDGQGAVYDPRIQRRHYQLRICPGAEAKEPRWVAGQGQQPVPAGQQRSRARVLHPLHADGSERRHRRAADRHHPAAHGKIRRSARTPEQGRQPKHRHVQRNRLAGIRDHGPGLQLHGQDGTGA